MEQHEEIKACLPLVRQEGWLEKKSENRGAEEGMGLW